MKVFIFSQRHKLYLGFMAAVFFLLGMLPNIVNVMAVDKNKPAAVYFGNKTEPKVAFSCNVFWGEELLPQMLDTLDKHNVKITFFIGGSWANRNTDMLKMIAKRGHELGNHSYSHPHPNALNKDQNKEEILKTEIVIENHTGIKPCLYAPPYGEFNANVLMAADELNYKTIMWSIDTIDWKRPPENIIINRVTKKLHNGAIVLMHPTIPTAKALSTLIEAVKTRGYTIGTVSSVLN